MRGSIITIVHLGTTNVQRQLVVLEDGLAAVMVTAVILRPTVSSEPMESLVVVQTENFVTGQ